MLKKVFVVNVPFTVEYEEFPANMAPENDMWLAQVVEEAVSDALKKAKDMGYNHSLSTSDMDITLDAGEITVMDSPVIEITYYKAAPTIKIPPGLTVEFKMIDTLEEGTLLLEYEGASIFWAIKDDHGDSYQKSEYWVSTLLGTDWEGDDVFDVRDLPLIPPKKQEKYMKLFPQEPDMKHEWKRRIAYAIDSGSITDDGYNPVK